jgi:pyroglutamyl-peptidase
MLRFYITGFGEFAGVPDNPTTHLVHNLASELAYNPLPATLNLATCTVLHVSAEKSLQTLQKLNHTNNEANAKDSAVPQRTIWLHFGVSGLADCINIESKAYNEADFRCPDQLGWEPQHEKIVEDGPPAIATTLNVDLLVSRLLSMNHKVRRSEDPGRFVCNWVYYHSLRESLVNDSHSLFIHMPNFNYVNANDQLKFALDLIYLIAELFGIRDQNNQAIRVSARNLAQQTEDANDNIAVETR